MASSVKEMRTTLPHGPDLLGAASTPFYVFLHRRRHPFQSISRYLRNTHASTWIGGVIATWPRRCLCGVAHALAFAQPLLNAVANAAHAFGQRNAGDNAQQFLLATQHRPLAERHAGRQFAGRDQMDHRSWIIALNPEYTPNFETNRNCAALDETATGRFDDFAISARFTLGAWRRA
jgi:hypothetical protein